MTVGLKRYYGGGHLHFITCSCRKRLAGLQHPSSRTAFLRCLEQVREGYGFHLVGYVVMPEHFHMLVSEPARGNPSEVMHALKQSSAREILDKLRTVAWNANARKLLAELVGEARDGDLRFWERRFHDFNVWSERKVWEKLEYMHMNPVRRALVARPDGWPWSSYRACALGDSSMLRVDCWPQSVPGKE